MRSMRLAIVLAVLAALGARAAGQAGDGEDAAARAERLKRRHESLVEQRDAAHAEPALDQRRRQVLLRIKNALADRLGREPTRTEVEGEIERLIDDARVGMDARADAPPAGVEAASAAGPQASSAASSGMDELADAAGDAAAAGPDDTVLGGEGLGEPARPDPQSRQSLREEVRRQTSVAIGRYLEELVRSERLTKDERDRILRLEPQDQVFATLELVKQQRLAESDDLAPEERARIEKAEPLDLLFGPDRARFVRPSSTQLSTAQLRELDALPRTEALRRRREMLRENAERALLDQGVAPDRARELAKPSRGGDGR